MYDILENQTICITGACGSIGKALVEQIYRYSNPKKVICIDNNESALFELKHFSSIPFKMDCYFCDIRNRDEFVQRTKGVDIIIHAAAMKHVDISEFSPNEAIATNIYGTQNVIKAAFENNVKITLFTSSDKAVNPTNVMGTSKLMGERLISAAGIVGSKSGQKFASTRFGNVLGSNGSVIPIFRQQARTGRDITLTDEKMTRFVMSKNQAADLVLQSLALVNCGEVFVTKMDAIYIKDLAELMLKKYGDSIDQRIITVGTKPGEKLYEELLSNEEMGRSMELDKFISIIPPLLKTPEIFQGKSRPESEYNSDIETKMNPTALENFMTVNGYFEYDT